MSDSIVNDVLHARYYQPGETSWEDVAKRVADYIGDTKEEKDEYYRLIQNKVFLPNSPCLMNAGTAVPMLSACFSIGLSDDINSILHTFHNAAIVMKYGGGVGIDFSPLRPKNTPIKSTGGTSSGPIEFMKLFDAHVETIKQGGKRRGAAIATMDISHPDIEDFITCKTTEGKLSNMNISVRITNDFMKTVENDGDWKLVYDDVVYKTIKAKDLYNLICESAWKYGEPGIIFIDEIKSKNPYYGTEYNINVNPCGEVTLMTCDGGGESCNLGSINVSKYYKPENDCFNYEGLEKDVKTTIRFLDKVIDKNFYPVPEIETMTKKFRRLGLGVMGFHDLLISMKIPYDSDEGMEMAELIMRTINDAANKESKKLGSIYGSFWSNLKEHEAFHVTLDHRHSRNIACTCIAPTGTIATIAGCSYGIEPIFSYVHKRYTWANGEKIGYMQIHPQFENDLNKLYSNDEDKFNFVRDHMFECGTIQDIEYLPLEFRNIYKTAMDISWRDHIFMQSTFQKYVDNNISKTVNLPNNATIEDIDKIYKLAWECSLKGVTVYRSGSRENEVLELKKEETKPNEVVVMKVEKSDSRSEKPRERNGTTYERQSGCGKLYITINEIDGKPYEVFVRTAGNGGCEANSIAIGRLISLLLRNSVPPKDIVRQLKRVKCDVAIKNKCDGKSCADIIGRCLEEYYDVVDEKSTTNITGGTNEWVYSEPTKPMIMTKKESNPAAKCPECGEPIMLTEGCMTCSSCGWSKCK